MALQLRRGTDSDRLAITPASGEPLFTTDTKRFYIGDGVTVGGVLLADAGNADSSGLQNTITSFVDSAYVNSRLNTSSFLDSAEAIALIDSDYINARVNTLNFLDSAEALSLIDSAVVQSRVPESYLATIIDSDYVNARVNDLNFLDSSEVFALIDSAYVLGKSQNYIDTQITNLIDAAPDALNTLNELAAAINDDSNFAVNITTSIATKLAKADFETYFDSHFAIQTTSDLSEGDKLFYTRDRFDSDLEERLGAIDFDIIPDADSVRSLGSADKRFKDLWLSGETLILGNISISDGGNGTISIAEVDSYGNATSAIGSLSAKNLDNAINLDLDSTGQQVVDAFAIADYRTARYIIQIEHDSDNKYHSTEILLMHNNSDVYLTEYAVLRTDSSLGEITADITGNQVRLLMTPSYTHTSIKAKRLIIDA